MTALRQQKDHATLLLSKGKLPAALAEFRGVLESMPGDLSARQKVAEILARQGHVDEAVDQYAEAVRRYAEEGLFFKAVALSRVILTLDPTHQLAQHLLAELYAQRNPARPSAPPPPVRPPPTEETHLDPNSIALASVRLVQAPRPPPPPAEAWKVAEPGPSARETLPRIPLFSSLSRDEFMAVLDGAMEARAYAAGSTLITEGEPGGSMYAVAQGEVSVWRKSRQVAVLGEGAFFGEMALLAGTWRMATVQAVTEVVVLEFSRESMDRIIGHYPGVRAGLEAFFRERLLANLMRANPLLQLLSVTERAELSAAFEPCGFGADQVVLDEGRIGAPVILLLRGRCSVVPRDPERGTYADLEEGDAFGALAALTQSSASVTVRTRAPVMALRVAADVFRAIVMANPEVNRRVRDLANPGAGRGSKAQLQVAV